MDWIKDSIYIPIKESIDEAIAKVKSLLPDAFEALKGGFGAAWNWIEDKIVAPVRRGVNTAIDLVNSIIRKINSIPLVSVPEIPSVRPPPISLKPGSSDLPGFGVGSPPPGGFVPTVPPKPPSPPIWDNPFDDSLFMAKGGIVTKPTRAVIGEAGPEAVIPLGSGGRGGLQNTVIVELDGRVLTEVVSEGLNNRIRLRGAR